MTNRKISVAVPAFRSAAFVDECVESILESHDIAKVPYDIEILLGIDKCEPTLYHCIKQPWSSDSRVKIFESSENVGTYVMVNSLHRESTGSIVGVIGSDDSVAPKWFSEMAGEFELDKYTSIDGVNSRQSVNGVCQRSVPTGCWFWRRGFLFGCLGGFKPWRVCADAEMYYRATLGWKARIRVIDSALYLYRIHPGQISAIPSLEKDRLDRRTETSHLVNRYMAGEKPSVESPITTKLERVK